MKYIISIALISIMFSCKKDNGTSAKYDPPPSVTNIQVSSQSTNGVAHPKFTITLNIPDTSAVKSFSVYPKNGWIPSVIQNPKSGTYVLVDIYNSYPAASNLNTYVSSFLMADNSSIYNSTFDVQ